MNSSFTTKLPPVLSLSNGKDHEVLIKIGYVILSFPFGFAQSLFCGKSKTV
jgi:hypothetical protein